MKKNNVKKVPVILQMEAVECGAASLGMVLGYYKKFVPPEQLRVDCNVSRDGSSAKYIYLAAKRYGLNAKAIKAEVDDLKEMTDFPVIIHWNFNHFVVLCGFKGDKAVINDPAEGRVLIEPEEFDNSFTGVVLEFSPDENFEPSGKPESTAGFVKRQIRGSVLAAAVIILAGFVIAACELVKPVFYKLFTDNVLIYAQNEWMRPILCGMAVVLVVCLAAEAIESVSLALLKSKMSIGLSSVFMWHILRLPVQFFSQRYAGDIASRQESNNDIAEDMCSYILPVALDMLMIGIYLYVMLWYNVLLAFVGIGVAVVNVAVIFYTSRKNANAARTVSRDEGKLSGVSIAALSMIETIKSSGSELGFFEKNSRLQS
ncbi:MAG: cysteine peptidase family C39 domain-containing protein [Clostridiales bacterium]|nr:cysteine peptidase family C39 domain-containing protein [Clostridiales bacterium]